MASASVRRDENGGGGGERHVDTERERERESERLTDLQKLTCIICNQFYRTTGLIYDEGMLHHRNDISPNHPEVPERISRAWEGLSSRGITARCQVLKVHAFTCTCVHAHACI